VRGHDHRGPCHDARRPPILPVPGNGEYL
jgi:hypothetical protein